VQRSSIIRSYRLVNAYLVDVNRSESTCLWRIVISAIIPQDSRPATVLRYATFSFFSSTFIYRLLREHLPG
jgi:hypothetical protein